MKAKINGIEVEGTPQEIAELIEIQEKSSKSKRPKSSWEVFELKDVGLDTFFNGLSAPTRKLIEVILDAKGHIVEDELYMKTSSDGTNDGKNARGILSGITRRCGTLSGKKTKLISCYKKDDKWYFNFPAKPDSKETHDDNFNLLTSYLK